MFKSIFPSSNKKQRSRKHFHFQGSRVWFRTETTIQERSPPEKLSRLTRKVMSDPFQFGINRKLIETINLLKVSQSSS